jgi:hypothetical protein
VARKPRVGIFAPREYETYWKEFERHPLGFIDRR